MPALELPLGLGHLPIWGVLVGAAIIGIGLGWLAHLSASDRINLVIAAVTIAGLGWGIWQWRSQLDREESRRHTDFASRIAVVAYLLPEGLEVTVRNANSAPASVVFFSLAHDSRSPENWEVNVEPCTQRSFTVSPRASWWPIVRKGGKDWSTGADPIEVSYESLLHTYGVKEANGSSQILIAEAPSQSSPVSDCA